MQWIINLGIYYSQRSMFKVHLLHSYELFLIGQSFFENRTVLHKCKQKWKQVCKESGTEYPTKYQDPKQALQIWSFQCGFLGDV